jgi:glycosyltransferase involved in cell wall biosynthesis
MSARPEAAAPLALDATLADEPTTGIALYAQELGRALAPRLPVERWGARRSGEVPRGRVGRSLWTVSALPGLLEARRPRAYHAVSNFNLPLQRVPDVPFVLTVHDLVPLLLPDTVSAPFRWQFQTWLARSLLVAEQVVCVSEVTRASLLQRFAVAADRVSVIHHGVDHVARVAPPDAVTLQWLDALGLAPDFVLYAGALDARKNVGLLLDACARLFEGGRRTTLVLAGQRWFGSKGVEARVRELKERGLDIRLLGYLEAPVFYALMRRAGVFVFPSRYEGFGLPPLEAMALGVPTIISTAGALPEVCGEGAAQVDPDDAQGLAAHLEALLGDEAARRALGARGLEVAGRYRWERTAEQTLKVYARLGG